MKKVRKEDRARLDAVLVSMSVAIDKVNAAVEAINEAVGKANDAISVYNDYRSEAEGIVGDIANSIEEYIDERTDRWRESEAGEKYSDWHQSWTFISDTLGQELEDIEEVVLFDHPSIEDIEVEIIYEVEG